MLARVRRTIRDRGLLREGDRVLVACSGGPDSAALLHVLSRLRTELGVELAAASVDHGLRADAARDVEAARALADRLGVPFTALEVHVPRGASLQANARAARYAALLTLADGRALAVGHTRDDQAETVLSRLLRGAGVRGLTGIDPDREDGVIRPLIDCRRGAVLRHVARHDLPVRQDPSNEDERFERVRLRRAVLPALLEEDARLVEHLAEIADDAAAIERWITRESAAFGPLDAASVDAIGLARLPQPVRRRWLADWVRSLTGKGARRAHVVGLERLTQGKGEVLLGGGWVVRVERRRLLARQEADHPSRSQRK